MSHTKTKDRIRLVMELTAFGCDTKYIAEKLEITKKELESIYKEEIEQAGNLMLSQLGTRLMNIALTGDPRVALPAIQFYLKCKAGWREPPRELELSGKNGKDLNFVGRDELLTRLADEFASEDRKSVN